MTASPTPIAESPEISPGSLAERIAQSSLSVGEILRYATPIAAALRDLHAQGLVYGAVSSRSILLRPAGAALQEYGGLRRLGNASGDIAAFGEVLRETLRGAHGREDLREELRQLAIDCQDTAADMQVMLIALRLLGLKARQVARMPRPAPSTRQEVAAKAEVKEAVRLRLHLSLHWKPLANLAAFALSGR
jgi:hypothetical protein